MGSTSSRNRAGVLSLSFGDEVLWVSDLIIGEEKLAVSHLFLWSCAG